MDVNVSPIGHDMLDVAVRVFGVTVDSLFAPSYMYDTCVDQCNVNVYTNNDAEALLRRFAENTKIWIHGSQSVAYKVLLRERQVDA
eukprot:10322000-Karenia_brevis.AAC.1